ncbi:nuclear transport factor 2 family protein [Winogradskyella tangerina]|uniref:nuclear transport factor 2 family protein n=1 Tax=Winogradskyella tangerina TaxID=2023240 RepID=UPI000DBE6F1A|nr:nuclear transport factor 2 family protein [Winogradskyella tangerina]
MKKLIVGFMLLTLAIHAQEDTNDYSNNVATLDSTIETLYNVISGDAGVERDWELFKHLFHKDAKLIPSGKSPEGKHVARYMTPDDYIQSSGKWLLENGFHEVELNRETHTFGNITQVFSTYESYRKKDDKEPFMRGINSIQLMNDGERWWIINIFWMQESKANPIPEDYLPKN